MGRPSFNDGSRCGQLFLTCVLFPSFLFFLAPPGGEGTGDLLQSGLVFFGEGGALLGMAGAGFRLVVWGGFDVFDVFDVYFYFFLFACRSAFFTRPCASLLGTSSFFTLLSPLSVFSSPVIISW